MSEYVWRSLGVIELIAYVAIVFYLVRHVTSLALPLVARKPLAFVLWLGCLMLLVAFDRAVGADLGAILIVTLLASGIGVIEAQ